MDALIRSARRGVLAALALLLTIPPIPTAAQEAEVTLDRIYASADFRGGRFGPARWLARAGRAERAVEVAALARHHPASVQETRCKTQELLAELQRRLEADAYAAAEERGRARDLEETVRELLAEMGALP